MSDGTVPVHKAEDATSDTPGEQITLEFEEAHVNRARNNDYFLWTAWVVVDRKAFKYSSHLDRSEAYRVAKSFGGVVTETPLVADFREREMTNGGQASDH